MDTKRRSLATRLPGGRFAAALIFLGLLAVGGIVFLHLIDFNRSAPYLLGTALATALAFTSIWGVIVNQLAALNEAENVWPVLEAKGAELEALIENLHAGFLTFDRQSVITSLNPAAEALFGYRPADLIGHPIARLIPEWREGHALLPIDLPYRAGKTAILEGRRKSGDSFWLEFASFAYQTPDGVQTAAIVQRLCDLVPEGTTDPVTETEPESAVADGNPVDEIADIDENRGPIRLVPTSLPELMIRAQMQVQPLAEERQIKLNLFTLPLSATVDRTRVSDALEVLLHSAIARSTGGSVVDVSLQQWENDAVFFITDFGSGATYEPLPSETEVSIGWEQGWDAARATAVQHGGSLGITNLDGNARLTWFRLPMCPAAGNGPRVHGTLAHQSYVQ